MRMMRWLAAVLLGLGMAAAWGQSGDGLIFPTLESGNALPGTQRNNHASTVVELKDGDVIAAWFAGSREGAPDVKIMGARLHDGQWSTPVVLASADGVACWNPALFHTHDGRLWLYYKYGTHPSTWKGARKWSDDEGRTWSKVEYLPDGILGPIKDKPLVLADGTIVSGSSVENGKWNAWIERSTDNGRSWTKFGPITVPEADDVASAASLAAAGEKQEPAVNGVYTKIYRPSKTTVGIIQPSVVWMGGEHLRFFARGHTRAARIAIADSWDDGKTWTQARFIDLPNPNSGIDAVRLKDGRIVLVFNDSYNKRTPLNLAVSRDGEHFKVFKTLEDGPGQYSYPAIIQASNGDLLVTYTWKRESIKFERIPLREVPEVPGR
jgi:predicted neuraminidase